LARANFQNRVNGTRVDSSDDFDDVVRRDQIPDAEVDDGFRSDVEFQGRMSTDENVDRCSEIHLRKIIVLLFSTQRK